MVGLNTIFPEESTHFQTEVSDLTPLSAAILAAANFPWLIASVVNVNVLP